MGVTFSSVPEAFGLWHIIVMAATVILAAGLSLIFRRMTEEKLIRLLFILGLAMLICEVWKQWFVHRYVYEGAFSTWFFPWQLCSMAMYCSFLMPFLKGRAQDTVLVFLSTFSLIAAAAAIIFPGDMLRPQILLFCHGFLFHAAMVVESAAAMCVLARRRKAPFSPAVLLFLMMAAVAEVINVISHAAAICDGISAQGGIPGMNAHASA